MVVGKILGMAGKALAKKFLSKSTRKTLSAKAAFKAAIKKDRLQLSKDKKKKSWEIDYKKPAISRGAKWSRKNVAPESVKQKLASDWVKIKSRQRIK